MKGSASLLSFQHTFERFEKEFVGSNQQFSDAFLQRAYTLFEQVLLDAKRMQDSLRYLTGFYVVLDYESNRPYQYWYDSTPKLLVEEDIQKLFREIAQVRKISGKEIDEYLGSGKTEAG